MSLVAALAVGAKAPVYRYIILNTGTRTTEMTNSILGITSVIDDFWVVWFKTPLVFTRARIQESI